MQKQGMRRRDLQVRSCPFVYTGGSEPILEKGKLITKGFVALHLMYYRESINVNAIKEYL